MFALLATIALWAAAAYLWIGPWTRPREWRGDYLFGNYHLLDVYLGVPLACAALGATIVLLAPARVHEAAALRVGAVLLASFGTLFLFDVVWSLFVVGAIEPSSWLDRGHIPRLQNEDDPRLGFRRKPHASWFGRVPGGDVVHYATDERGFRNSTGITTADLVFVGDSYTEGAQVDRERTFVHLTALDLGCTAVNLGRGAYGPPQELEVLKDPGLSYRPRAVVWQLFEGNDLKDAEEFLKWRGGARVVAPLLERYLENSLFHPFLVKTYRSKRGHFAVLKSGDGACLPLELRYARDPARVERHAEGLAATLDALAAGAKLCAENDARLLVLFIPTLARVARSHLQIEDEALRRRFLPDEPPDADDFRAHVARFCDEQGITFADAVPAFEQAMAEDPRDLYIPDDEHLGVRGHELVADLVTLHLR